MIRIGLDYSDIKRGSNTIVQNIEGTNYTFTIRCPLFDNMYYLDMYNEGEVVFQALPLFAYNNVLQLEKYKIDSGGSIMPISIKGISDTVDIRYPMMGNGWELYYFSAEELDNFGKL